MNENELPKWYQSTNGPQVSKTIINILASILPVINFALASKGINIMPDSINSVVTLLVFAYFAIQAVIGYVRAKIIMQQKVAGLEAHVRSLGGVVGHF